MLSSYNTADNAAGAAVFTDKEPVAIPADCPASSIVAVNAISAPSASVTLSVCVSVPSPGVNASTKSVPPALTFSVKLRGVSPSVQSLVVMSRSS